MVDWSKLAKLMAGHLVLPSDPTYDLLRKPFNARVNSLPVAVARCVNEDDVVQCVKFAMDNNIAVTMRSGGHSAEGAELVIWETYADLQVR